MKKILLIASLLFSVNTFANQAVRENAEENNVATDAPSEMEEAIICPITEKRPEFPGGTIALKKYLSENVEYPKKALRKRIQGKVIVKFVIEKNGSISNVSVIKSVHPLLDAEAARVVGKMPNWQPGENGGKVVRSYFTLPVDFRLSK